MKTSVKVTGIDEVDQLLSRIAPRQGYNIMRAALTDAAKDISKEAQDFAPRNEGDLEGAIHHKRLREKPSGVLRSAVKVEKDAFYWRFLEFGFGPDGVEHLFMARAAAGWSRETFKRSFARKFDAALKRATRRQGG